MRPNPFNQEHPSRRLGEVAPLQTGFAFKSDWYVGDGVRLLRNANIHQGFIAWDDVVSVDPTLPNRFATFRLNKNDIVLTLDRPIVGSGLKVARLTATDVPALLNQRVGRFRPDPAQLDSDYLYAFVRSPRFIQAISGHDQSLGVPHISPSQVENVRIPLPPLERQRQVAETLAEQLTLADVAKRASEDRVEAAIELVNAHLREAFGTENTASWPAARLGELANTCSGSTPPRGSRDYFGGNVPWVKTGELKDGIIEATEETVTEVALEQCPLPRLPVGTLLVAMYGQGQTRGRTGLLACEATTNQACFAILPRPDVFSSDYLQLWFRANYGRLRAMTDSRGGNQPNLNGLILRQLEIPLPPVSVQRETAAKLSEQLAATQALVKAVRAEFSAVGSIPSALLRTAFE